MNKTYLGDGVYASFDGFQVLLETDDSKIFLDPDTYCALVNYVQNLEHVNGPDQKVEG